MIAQETVDRRSGELTGRDVPECFDPSLARFPTRVLLVEEVVDLLAITHAPERVEEYRLRMLAGERFPPVSVIRLAGRFIVADGHKRLTACRALDVREISVELWTWSRLLRDQGRQALRNVGKNATILRRSLSDPAEAARLFKSTLRHWARVAVCLASRIRPESRFRRLPSK